MRPAAALALAALLAGCTAERAPDPAPTPAATVAAPRTLVAADLDPATLGPRVAGIAVEDMAVGGRAAPLARVSAFVACARGMTACDPAVLPEGTIYTYFLTITPAPPAAAPVASASTVDPAAPAEAPAELVGMSMAAAGFNGAVGFAHAEAAVALGKEDALGVTLDQNRLIWRVTGGSGWTPERPITLWWQSTRPPAGQAAAYRLEYAGQRADIRAPFPAEDKAVERDSPR